ncbi:MAG: ABC transporter permease [Bacteroidales bacterium]|nr:ABC transporter permease [Bacteroidales bacterium]
MVIIANVIALPLTWVVADRWLNSFAYKTSFDSWIMAGVFLLTSTLSLAVVYYLTTRAARENPAEAPERRITQKKKILMYKHIFSAGFKSLFKEKGFTVINMIGLSIGIAATIIILLYITDQNELMYHFNLKKGAHFIVWKTIGGPYWERATAPHCRGEFPAIEQYTRIDNFRRDALFSYEEKDLYVDNLIYADSGFFNIFSVSLIYGSPDELF